VRPSGECYESCLRTIKCGRLRRHELPLYFAQYERRDEGTDSERRQRKPLAAAHLHRREAARSHREQAHPVLRIEALVAAEIATSRSSSPSKPATRCDALPATVPASARASHTSTSSNPAVSPRQSASPRRDGRRAVRHVPRRQLHHPGDRPLRRGVRAWGADAGILLKRMPDARAFGVAQFEGERLVRVIEKPAEPPSDLAVVGILYVHAVRLRAIDRIKPSARASWRSRTRSSA